MTQDLILSALCFALWVFVAFMALCRLNYLKRGHTLPSVGYGYIALLNGALAIALQPITFRTYAGWADVVAALITVCLMWRARLRWSHGAPAEFHTLPTMPPV